MAFKSFFEKFAQTAYERNAPIPNGLLTVTDGDFQECISILGGKSFNNGLYRVCRGDQILSATKRIIKVFPEVNDRIFCFGYDWLGRYFAIDRKRIKNGKPLILLLEPGAGEMMQIPVPIVDFHNDELVQYTNDALASNFFDEWCNQAENRIAKIRHYQCVGYLVPLFLGGSDTVENLELIDLDVYLELCGQLRSGTINLPEGQTISSISIEDSY